MSSFTIQRRTDDASVFVGVRLPQSLRARMEALAKESGMSLSEVVRCLLEAGLNASDAA